MSNGNVFERLFKLWAAICKMIMDGQRDPERMATVLQGIVDEPDPEFITKTKKDDNPKGLATLDMAIKTLGYQKVITADAEAKTWGKVIVAHVSIRYTEATLLQAAQENKSGQADWRLIFVSGYSLREQLKILGTNEKKQPCFYKGLDGGMWFLDSKEDGWSTRRNQAGYYLIDFRPHWDGMDHDKQGARLKKMGPKFERVDPAVFSSAVLTDFKVSGVRLINYHEHWYHWSEVMSSSGNFITVGLVPEGLRINAYPVYNGASQLRVCIFWKFDA